MNKTGLVYYNNIPAGRLEFQDNKFVFTYSRDYLADRSLPPIALSLPKTQVPFQSPVLFPFFSGLLAEGVNKELQCAMLKIDPDDHFTRLLKTSFGQTIGAVSVREEP